MMLSFHGTTFPYLFCLVVNAGLTWKNTSQLLTDVDGSQPDCIPNRRFDPVRHGSPGSERETGICPPAIRGMFSSYERTIESSCVSRFCLAKWGYRG